MRTLSFIILITILSACNTMEGVGRDVQAAGHAITGGAEDGRQRINR